MHFVGCLAPLLFGEIILGVGVIFLWGLTPLRIFRFKCTIFVGSDPFLLRLGENTAIIDTSKAIIVKRHKEFVCLMKKTVEFCQNQLPL